VTVSGNTYARGFPQTVNQGDALTFDLSPSPVTNNLNISTNIPTNFWSVYSSVDGSGLVGFQFRNQASVLGDTGGTSPLVDGSAFQGIANVSVTYTYTAGPEPIPEPSTVAAGAFLTLMAAATYWRRRRSAR
jgi:hypothetical protein